MAAFDFPNSPVVDQVYVANGVSYKWDGQAWVGGPALDNTHVLRAGDTMTGNLVIDPVSSSPELVLDKPTPAATYGSIIRGKLAGVHRWAVSLGSASAESGSNVGSEFIVHRYDDAGAFVDNPLVIQRADAHATFGGLVTVKGAPATGHAIVEASKTASGNASQFKGMTNGVGRWTMQMGDVSAESTGNAGSNFLLTRHNDAGTGVENVLVFNRASGKMSTPQSAALAGAGFPAAVETSPHTFTGYLTCNNTLGMNAYVKAGAPAVWASYNGGTGGYLTTDVNAGNITLGSASANPGVGGALAIASRLTLYGAGYSYAQPRFLATDAGVAGQAVVGCYQTTQASAMGWLIGSAGSFSCFNLDGVGVISGSSLGAINRMGWTGLGYAATMGFYDNNAGALIVQWNGTANIYYQTANGTLTFTNAGAVNMQIPAGGNLDITGGGPTKAGAGQWLGRSDERIKMDIRDYEAGLDQVLAIRPRVFQYRPETHMTVVGKDQIGLIAQELETVMPECVFAAPGEAGEIELEDMRILDPTAIMYALVNAVKTLTARVAELEAAR